MRAKPPPPQSLHATTPLVTASVSPNTHETDARVLPHAWHSSRSLEDSALAAYHAALYDAGRPFSKPSVTRPCATSV